ncbi:MAG: hypothetical protein BWY06_02510 [Candidatus Latescibacteria bacterium ADurb.Bin168]|nr:MAG: hypothetical protein BWY06_02510 [Candidatus Latescibacteria bacterium ADurb.Bin168]
MRRLDTGRQPSFPFPAIWLILLAACMCPRSALRADQLPVAPLPADFPVWEHWTHFTTENGLPSDKIMSVAVDGDAVWVGTDNGLALLEQGRVTEVYTPANGLAHRAVISLSVDGRSHDVWAGTMGGLTRISGGKLTTFTQFNSGLANDVVFGVCVENNNVWFATTAGTGRFRVRENAWDVWTPETSPQHEPWGYFVDYDDAARDEFVYAALWGGGLMEYDLARGTWKGYLDPDGEMEVDVFRDDGIVHVITTGCSARAGLVWVSTYFGLSSYDRKRWRAYMTHDTGLASEFINFVKARGRRAVVCTDKGISMVDYDTNHWVTYARDENGVNRSVRIFQEDRLIQERKLEVGLSNTFTWGCDFQGDSIWVATAKGLSLGWVTTPSSTSR